jgi:hypothetical protein
MYVFSKEECGVKITLVVNGLFKVKEVTVKEIGKGDFFKIGKICSETKVLLSSCVSNRTSFQTQKLLAEKTVKAYEFIDSTIDVETLSLHYKREEI